MKKMKWLTVALGMATLYQSGVKLIKDVRKSFPRPAEFIGERKKERERR